MRPAETEVMVSQLCLMWGSTQHCQTLCLGACPRYNLVVDEDVKTPNQPNKQKSSHKVHVFRSLAKVHLIYDLNHSIPCLVKLMPRRCEETKYVGLVCKSYHSDGVPHCTLRICLQLAQAGFEKLLTLPSDFSLERCL